MTWFTEPMTMYNVTSPSGQSSLHLHIELILSLHLMLSMQFMLSLYSHGRSESPLVASQLVLVIKNVPVQVRRASSIPGLGRCPGGGHGNPLQYSCLENPMDREAWLATVQKVSKSWTRLKQLSKHTHIHTDLYNDEGNSNPRKMIGWPDYNFQ